LPVHNSKDKDTMVSYDRSYTSIGILYQNHFPSSLKLKPFSHSHLTFINLSPILLSNHQLVGSNRQQYNVPIDHLLRQHATIYVYSCCLNNQPR